MKTQVASLTCLLLISAQEPPGIVEIGIAGLRAERGLVHVCLTRDRRHFPNCIGDPQALRQTVPASTHQLRFVNVAAGVYAVTLFHDANSNRRLDTMLGIPREGFGFSRNPKIRFGAPRFEEVNIKVAAPLTRTVVQVQYLL